MSDEDTIEKALELGTLYFKNEDFKNAQSLFTKALKLALSYDESSLEKIRTSHGLSSRPLPGMGDLVHPRLVKLLDNRAAAWEKMGDLQKALKDSQRCIRFEPFNLKCYLRRGKILQKLGSHQEALENYHEGLRKMKEMENRWHLDSSTKLVDLVKYQISLINSRIKPQVSLPKTKRVYVQPPKEASNSPAVKFTKVHLVRGKLDIVGQCPLEILKVILSKLETKQLVRCLMVCKVWLARICMLPEVFSRFDISSCNHRAIVAFQNFVNKIYRDQMGSRIDSLRFSSSALSVESRSLTTLIQNLEPRVKTLMLHSKTTDFEQLTLALSKNLPLATSLEGLSLSCDYRGSASGFLDHLFVSSVSNVRHLDLVFLSSTANKGSINIPKGTIANESLSLQKLKSFKLICDLRKMSPFFPLKSLLLSDSFQRLEKLYICGATFDVTMKFDWLCHVKNLKELWLENNKNAYLEDFVRALIYVPVFPLLKKLTFREHRIANQALNLRQYPQLMENTILIGNVNTLEHLDLMSTSIGALGLLSILSLFAFDKLEKLNIGDCPYIHFQRGNDNGYMDIKRLLQSIPHIEELLLPQSVGLDDHCLKLFSQNVKYVKKLRKLDLSFNMSLTGVSIYELLRALRDEFVVLDKLEIDGCPSIMESTANALKQSSMVKDLSCSYEKLAWRVYGANSLVSG
ncbi:LAME_0D00914g1_1 [Lachancea meyersii CBS 8951]|uniref:LAME_0D00914g1_1 n=1 Tax=Lachancea meyersii CBS 8951 TaxID=1266667 RepID=A0A1G4J666_9SACH|nr:LAME_0D00914g1_1 [Lachancea meyersii CBS 8951]